jgi:(1->4)-alpha-D-glucan 1-alpha-D-glucosylmutase
MTAPGVPDFYQGTELWDLSFVDPDNRRAVDYELRRSLLDALSTDRQAVCDLARELLKERRDGRLKLHVMSRGLRERATRPAVFRDGAYAALDVAGERRGSAFAFARHLDGDLAVTLVPRIVSALTSDGAPPVGRAVWQGTRVDLTALGTPRMLYNVFTNAEVPPSIDAGRWFIDAAAALADLPVALLAPAPQAAFV